jgi:hypothetical protein
MRERELKMKIKIRTIILSLLLGSTYAGADLYVLPTDTVLTSAVDHPSCIIPETRESGTATFLKNGLTLFVGGLRRPVGFDARVEFLGPSELITA